MPELELASGRPGRRPARVAAAVVALAALATYAGTLGHGFVLDDGPEVVNNFFIRSLSDVPRILTTGSWEGTGEGSPPQYRPLTTFTYALNHALGGLGPFGYHLVNVLLHALASALVLALGLRAGLPLAGASLAGLLFAVHPVHVEAVANVAGRKDVLVTVLFLAAALAHGAALRRGTWPALLGAVLAFGGALASKESGLVLFAVLAARDLLLGREDGLRAPRTTIALYGAYAAEIALYLWARWAAVGSLLFPMLAFEENPIAFAPASQRVLSAIAVLGKGLLLLVVPGTLSPDYSFRAIPAASGIGDPRVLLSALAIGGLVALAVWARGRWPVGLLALLWYGVTIFPTSNLVVRIGTIFGERLLYLPSVGFCLAAGGLLGALLLRSSGGEPAAGGARGALPLAARAGVATLLVALSARTLAYARDWADEPSLYASAARSQPESSRARRLHGGSLMEQGRPAEAAAEFEAALAILSDPAVPPAVRSRPRMELGVAFEALGRLADAARLYESVAAEDPGNADAPWRMGVVRWREGRRDEAVVLWSRAVAADPGHARALSDLGLAAWLSGDLAAARRTWQRAAEADPTVASVWYRLGKLHETEGDLAAARAAWTEFLRRSVGRHPEWRAEVEARLRSWQTAP
jgi:tetratricopeptide (TPR) repeat protein